MKEVLSLIKQARFVFTCGNGGSAATAEHLSNDLFSKKIKALCLNSNTSIMTMIGNDFGYDKVFSMQLERYATADDLLITISASGTSPNIVNAIAQAKSIGMKVYEFESAKDKSNIDYEGLEDRHMQFVHKIKQLL